MNGSFEHDVHQGESTAHRAWYRRRGPQAAVAGTAAAALAVVGFSMGSAANATVNPEDAVAEAQQNLQQLPSSVTLTGSDMAGEITLLRTDEGAQVTVDAADQGVYFSAALLDDRVYFRVAGDQFSGVAGNPIAQGLTAGYPSITALLDGQWVSIDVSEDSEVLAAMQDLVRAQVEIPEGLGAAAEDLQASMKAIGEDLRTPLQDALADNVSVAAGDGVPAGPAGSDHYIVSLDSSAVATELEPVLRQSLEQALAAVDAFVADAGADLPGVDERWNGKSQEILDAFDQAIAEALERDTAAMDVWIADGEFTQITVENATLTFDRDAQLDGTTSAVSMDEDLLRILPLLSTFELPQTLPFDLPFDLPSAG